jgi:hypothetical protein
MSGVDMYYRFASGFGSLQHLIDPYLSPFVGPIIGAIVSLTVQYFFAYRVWIMSNRKSFWLCLLICTVSRSKCTNLRFGSHLEPIFFIVLYCRCYSSIHWGYLCEPPSPLSHVRAVMAHDRRHMYGGSSLVAGR